MSLVFKEMITGTTLTGVASALYTAPALTSASIQAATVYNPTTAPVTLSFYKVPNAAAADNTTLIGTRSIPAGQTMQINEAINHKLQAGTSLNASGIGLTLNVSGVEYIPE